MGGQEIMRNQTGKGFFLLIFVFFLMVMLPVLINDLPQYIPENLRTLVILIFEIILVFFLIWLM
jgi:hypothetical protein